MKSARTRVPRRKGSETCAMSSDIEDRTRRDEALRAVRAETALAGEKQLLEMIASGRALPDVLRALCRFFEAAAADCFCGVYPIEWSGPTFQNGVAPSLSSAFLFPCCPPVPEPHATSMARTRVRRTFLPAAEP